MNHDLQLSLQAVSKSWNARFADDPKLWASVDLSSDERLRKTATDDLLLDLMGRSRDRWGTSYLTSVDVSGCKVSGALLVFFESYHVLVV